MAEPKILKDVTKKNLGYQEDENSTNTEDKATTLSGEQLNKPDYTSLFNTGKTTGTNTETNKGIEPVTGHKGGTENRPPAGTIVGNEEATPGTVLDEINKGGGININNDNITSGNGVQYVPGSGSGDGSESNATIVPLNEGGGGGIGGGNPPTQPDFTQINQTIKDAENQKTETAMGAEAPTGFKYSWQKNAEDIALTKYLENLHTANANATNNALQLERSRQDYLAANEMAGYTRRQTADKMGWAAGKPQSEDRQLSYMKATIAASLYSATELQRAGYESSLAQARYQYENNLVQASMDQYKLAVDDAYKQAQLTGIYISPELKEMNANYNMAKKVIDDYTKDNTSVTEEEYKKALNIYNTVEDWYIANGVSSKGIVNVAYFLELKSTMNANFAAELQNYFNELQLNWYNKIAKGETDITNYDKTHNLELEQKEWEVSNEENKYYSSLHSMFEKEYGENIYIKPYYIEENGKQKPIIDYGEIKSFDFLSSTSKDYIKFFQDSNNNKQSIKGLITNLVNEAVISYTQSLSRNEEGQFTEGTTTEEILNGINTRINKTILKKINDMLIVTDNEDLKKEIQTFLNDIKVAVTVGDNSCIVQFNNGYFTKEYAQSTENPGDINNPEDTHDTEKPYGNLQNAVEQNSYLDKYVTDYFSNMNMARWNGTAFENSLPKEQQYAYMNEIIKEYKKKQNIPSFSYSYKKITEALNWYKNLKYEDAPDVCNRIETYRFIDEVLRGDEPEIQNLFKKDYTDTKAYISNNDVNSDEFKIVRDVLQKIGQWTKQTTVGKLKEASKFMDLEMDNPEKPDCKMALINMTKDTNGKSWLKAIPQTDAKIKDNGEIVYKNEVANYLDTLINDMKNDKIAIGSFIQLNYGFVDYYDTFGIYLGNGVIAILKDKNNMLSNKVEKALEDVIWYLPEGYKFINDDNIYHGVEKE